MKTITYKLTDPLGLHARPAGVLAKDLMQYKSDIQIGRSDNLVNAKRVMGIMKLCLKQGEEITLTFSGEDEDAAAAATEKFLKENV